MLIRNSKSSQKVMMEKICQTTLKITRLIKASHLKRNYKDLDYSKRTLYEIINFKCKLNSEYLNQLLKQFYIFFYHFTNLNLKWNTIHLLHFTKITLNHLKHSKNNMIHHQTETRTLLKKTHISKTYKRDKKFHTKSNLTHQSQI